MDEDFFSGIIEGVIIRLLFTRFGLVTGVILLAVWGASVWESEPRVNITDLDVYHNVKRSSGKNIKMVLDFKTAHLKNCSCVAIVYFYDQNGNKVRSTTRGYRTKGGQLSTSDDFRPTYKYSIYEDFTLYIPNKYFNRGSYKGKVKTYCEDGFIGNSKSFQFTVRR